MSVKSIPTPKKSGAKTKGRSDAFDAHIGKTLKTLRSMRGLSQEQLATTMGITFQQVQKYEAGANRISATRLYQIARILDVSVTDFYEGYEKPAVASSLLREIEKDKELVALVRDWQRIKDKDLKKTVLKVLDSFLKAEER